MPFRMLAHKPVATARIDMGVTPITTAAWTTLVASMSFACSAIEIYNPSGSTILIATGAAAAEVPLPYTVLPGGSSILIPFEISKGLRVSAKAVDMNAVTNIFILNFFG